MSVMVIVYTRFPSKDTNATAKIIAMMEQLNVIEEHENYKAQVNNIKSTLSMTENALHDSLAHEEQLKAELDNTRNALRNSLAREGQLKSELINTRPTLSTPSSRNRRKSMPSR